MTLKQKTIHTSFTKENDYLYHLVEEQSQRTGIKKSTIIVQALEEYYAQNCSRIAHNRISST